jgi:hypothetical protein
LVTASAYGRRTFRRSLVSFIDVEVVITAMSIVRTTRAALALGGLFMLSACGLFQAEYPDKQAGQDSGPAWGKESYDNGFANGLFSGVFGSDKKVPIDGVGIGINAYLWRASLETLSFMPLASADPFGGVIITDWYAPPESPNERFKMSVYITDRELHADGIRVAVFRQVKTATSDWTDAAIATKTATDLENAILTRARELRTAITPIKKS